ncbi:MAG TPA: glycerol-3-phosphate dehydrogenase/oxidase [Mycobacteriales bacterium]|nr:glycerol-3-phosphate dehydrogenase/oxidase [Mycobacteriales bacterium]
MTGPVRSTSLNRDRRAVDLDALAGGEVLDLLVVGGGVTGVGVALDAATRGLRVGLLERHDLAFGTSRWSSKLVHGGLRYLASGDVRLAHQSAVERNVLLRYTAPHLTRALPMVVPITDRMSRREIRQVRVGVLAGDLLRAAAGTPRGLLPRPRRLSATETLSVLPAVRAAGLRAGVLTWDGQLTDDARLVVALARTAAGHGARVLTRTRVTALDGSGAQVTDTLGGGTFEVRARSVVNATGVWAGALAPEVTLRPSRGTHLVVRAAALGNPGAGLTVPVPGERNRYVFVLPQRDGHVYVGLTDEPVDGDPPDLPEPTRREIRFLLDTVNAALDLPLADTDVLGAFAGMRPLLPGSAGATADLSRRHVVARGPDGVLTVVGGKLTTYRAMAADAVDAAVRHAGLPAGPCRTRRLPAVGAAPRGTLARIRAPRRLVDRYGTEAGRVLAEAAETAGVAEPAGRTGLARSAGTGHLLRPLAEGVEVTGAEVLFAIRHEGALDAEDVLDRRTRLGLVPAERRAALPCVRDLLAR